MKREKSVNFHADYSVWNHEMGHRLHERMQSAVFFVFQCKDSSWYSDEIKKDNPPVTALILRASLQSVMCALCYVDCRRSSAQLSLVSWMLRPHVLFLAAVLLPWLYWKIWVSKSGECWFFLIIVCVPADLVVSTPDKIQRSLLFQHRDEMRDRSGNVIEDICVLQFHTTPTSFRIE